MDALYGRLTFPRESETNQARKAIRVNQLLDEQQKKMLARIQSGILWFQSELALVLFVCWMATTLRFGNPLARHWFGVTDIHVWNTGVATVGGIVCLVRSAVLGVRVLVWHREYLQIFPHTTTCRKIQSSEKPRHRISATLALAGRSKDAGQRQPDEREPVEVR